MKKLLAIILCFLGVNTFAQDKYIYVSLDVNKPLSNTEWLGKTSGSGIKAGYRKFINEKFSAGLDIGWSTYSEYIPKITVQTGSGAFTTDYYHYVYNYTALVSGQYNFKVGNGETFFPYAGIGVGAVSNEYARYYSTYSDGMQSWGLVARPELGILAKFTKSRSIGAMATVHYNYSTSKAEVFNYKNFSSIGFQVGLVFIDL